ncbi:glucan endo-1,3-beta-glucosidase-like [Dendrobium catenatum]|uniref:Glucan endo-1,3-beta-glucosidase, basic isoform n=1 Tax=Dendrobium catenatum TaxID=906689 RepID=A0A2I0W5I6_9ASPA|nr:glucan endo-1,3-beta-glucosidase-like [Dendrobium catenatum]PKU70928.1 Glucan endo-1,3-beta-glucosidase, basic isoform [Dendrobium catenatum]
MGPILQFFANNGALLLVNVYAYFAYAGDPANIRLDYALFAASEPVVIDVQFNYSNMFDAIVDSVYYAMENIGGHEVGIVVSETGWPSDGGTATTIDNAQTYITKLIKHVGQGTPKRPGSLETYIFAMFNENQKPAGVEQHWGLFYPQKTPVFPIIFPK